MKAKGRGGVSSLEALTEGKDGELAKDSSALMRSDDPGALAELEAEETRRQLRQAVASLEEAQRKAVELVDIEGLSYDEAALVLEIPVNTVRSRLSRARGALKQKIQRLRKRMGE
jgi:RNA polymerase sigma-70 factor (ECF subfamily)